MKKKVEYRNKRWFSLNDLADFIAEYTRDSKVKKDAWAFWDWLDRKCKPKKMKKKIKGHYIYVKHASREGMARIWVENNPTNKISNQ